MFLSACFLFFSTDPKQLSQTRYACPLCFKTLTNLTNFWWLLARVRFALCMNAHPKEAEFSKHTCSLRTTRSLVYSYTHTYYHSFSTPPLSLCYTPLSDTLSLVPVHVHTLSPIVPHRRCASRRCLPSMQTQSWAFCAMIVYSSPSSLAMLLATGCV